MDILNPVMHSICRSHRTGVSTFANRCIPTRRPKFAKELPPLPPDRKLFFKTPPLKIFKTADTQAKQTEIRTNKMTSKTQKYRDLTLTEDRRPAYNSVYVAIAGEMVTRRSVLLRNIVLNGQESASNPLLHIHAKRWLQFLTTQTFKTIK